MELIGYYAQLDSNNIVTQVITGVPQTELIEGITATQWYSNFTGVICVPTYMNLSNKTYAGIGYTWNGTDFVPPPLIA